MRRFYEIKIIVENESKNLAEGLREAKQIVESLGLKAADVRAIESTRTLAQNRSLHKLMKELSDECLDKGITLNDIVKDGYEVEATPENLKMLWKKLQNSLFGTKSTTELKKTGQIEVVYRNFNKILIERTSGELSLPPWPSLDLLIER